MAIDIHTICKASLQKAMSYKSSDPTANTSSIIDEMSTIFANNLAPIFTALTTPSVITTKVGYSLLDTDFIVVVETSKSAVTVKLPAHPVSGQIYVIKDGGGMAGTYNITVDGNGNRIDGENTSVILTNYGARSFCFIGDSGTWISY